MRFLDRLIRLFRRPEPAKVELTAPPAGVQRGSVDHIIVLDGTLASLLPGRDSNAGRAYRLLCERVPGSNRRFLYYEPGLQWENWRDTMDVLQGRGIDRQICRAYGWLASHYRPGDRIYLFGYSRGAFAVRSLAGVIDRVGLLRQEEATERNVALAWRHYQGKPDSRPARLFALRHCHDQTGIEMVGVWDTVKALGVRLPLLWLLTEGRNAFHSHQLGRMVRHGFQALALHETRAVFRPVLWHSSDAGAGANHVVQGGPDPCGQIEQMWFRGAHGDVGGQLSGYEAARPLANIPLVWMLGRAEACGLNLPPGWRDRFPCDPHAPMVGAWRGFGAAFLLRAPRHVGLDPSERLHPSVLEVEPERWSLFAPRLTGPMRDTRQSRARLTIPE